MEEEEEEERGQRCYCFLEQPGGTTGPFRKEGGGGKVKQTHETQGKMCVTLHADVLFSIRSVDKQRGTMTCFIQIQSLAIRQKKREHILNASQNGKFSCNYSQKSIIVKTDGCNNVATNQHIFQTKQPK